MLLFYHNTDFTVTHSLTKKTNKQLSFPKTNCFDHYSSSSAIIDTSNDLKHKPHQRVTTEQKSNKQPKIKQTNKQTNKQKTKVQ